MDRRRARSPVYGRQWSGGSSSAGSSPSMSPAHPQSRLGSGAGGVSTIKRSQNIAAKAAAQRLAQVMASQTADDYEEEEDDDLGFRYSAPPPPVPSSYASSINSNNSISSARVTRSPSPAVSSNDSIVDLILRWNDLFCLNIAELGLL